MTSKEQKSICQLVKSNLKDGDLYVGDTKVEPLNSGKLDI